MFLLFITTVIVLHTSGMESYLLSEQQTKVTDASSARSKTAILHKCVSWRPLRLLGLIKQSEEGMSARGLATEPLTCSPGPSAHAITCSGRRENQRTRAGQVVIQCGNPLKWPSAALFSRAALFLQDSVEPLDNLTPTFSRNLKCS